MTEEKKAKTPEEQVASLKEGMTKTEPEKTPAASKIENPAEAKPKPAGPPKPTIVEQDHTPVSEDWQKELLDALGDKATESYVASGEFTIVLENGEAFPETMALIHENGYDYLSDISSVDYSKYEGAPKRFALSYHLYSVAGNHRLRVKVFLEDGEAVPSVMHIWATADFHEREAFDLMGIVFSGREGLRRILLPEDWIGHPLRKELSKNDGNAAYTARLVRKVREDA
jgi:NADH-quinone oxidoreductase subunit C